MVVERFPLWVVALHRQPVAGTTALSVVGEAEPRAAKLRVLEEDVLEPTEGAPTTDGPVKPLGEPAVLDLIDESRSCPAMRPVNPPG